MLETPLQPGTVLAERYEVEEELGEGGMGVVLRCRDRETEGAIALKLLKPKVAGKRVLREAQAASLLTSKHVARVHDTGTLPSGTPYIAMDLLTGDTLRAVLTARGPLPPEDACELVMQACVALAEAHQRGIVHRDLKPSNLHVERVGERDVLRVLDFGIAKMMSPTDGDVASLTATGSVMGSPRYMSPEQLRDAKAVDARSDIWALGVVLYEMLAGRPPFEASSAEGLCAMIAADDPTPLEGIDDGLADIATRCLNKERSARFVNVAQLAEALLPFAGSDADAHLRAIHEHLPPDLDSTATIEPTDAMDDDPGEVPTSGGHRIALAAAAVAVVGVGLYVAQPTSPTPPVDEPQPTRTIAPEESAPVTEPPRASVSTRASAAPTAVVSSRPALLPSRPTSRPVRSASPEVVERDDPLDDRR